MASKKALVLGGIATAILITLMVLITYKAQLDETAFHKKTKADDPPAPA